MKLLAPLFISIVLFLFSTGCGTLNKVAWQAIGKDGDTIMQELGQAQAEFKEAQVIAADALGIKNEIVAVHTESQKQTEAGVNGFDQSSATNYKESSKGTAKASELLKEAMAKTSKLDENGTKLMAQANALMSSATLKMGKNIAETIAVCVSIKDLYDSGEPQNKAAAAVLLLPAVTMGSHVLSDGKACHETAKALRQYAKDQDIEVDSDEEISTVFGDLENVDEGGLPTEADSEKENSDKTDDQSEKSSDSKNKLGGFLPKFGN